MFTAWASIDGLEEPDVNLEAALACLKMKQDSDSVRVGFCTRSLFAFAFRVAMAF